MAHSEDRSFSHRKSGIASSAPQDTSQFSGAVAAPVGAVLSRSYEAVIKDSPPSLVTEVISPNSQTLTLQFLALIIVKGPLARRRFGRMKVLECVGMEHSPQSWREMDLGARAFIAAIV